LAALFLAPPANAGLSLIDNGVCVVHTYDIGYWSLAINNSLASTDYDLDLEADGFSSPPIIASSRLLTRSNSSNDWIADGTHVPAVGNTVKRANISILSAEYTVGDELPTVTATGDVTGNTSDDGAGDCMVAIAITDAVFSDNCSGSSLTWVMSGATTDSGSGQVSTHSFNLGVTKIVYTVTDGALNTAKDSLDCHGHR